MPNRQNKAQGRKIVGPTLRTTLLCDCISLHRALSQNLFGVSYQHTKENYSISLRCLLFVWIMDRKRRYGSPASSIIGCSNFFFLKLGY